MSISEEANLIMTDRNAWLRSFLESRVPSRSVVQIERVKTLNIRKQKIPKTKFLNSHTADVVFENADEDEEEEADGRNESAGPSIPAGMQPVNPASSSGNRPEGTVVSSREKMKHLTLDEREFAGSVLHNIAGTGSERLMALVDFQREYNNLLRADKQAVVDPDVNYLRKINYTKSGNKVELAVVRKKYKLLLDDMRESVAQSHDNDISDSTSLPVNPSHIRFTDNPRHFRFTGSQEN